MEDDRIQILDLHTPNPIISYRNHIFDCRWASTIGTDLLITEPNPESEFPKLRENQGYEILAASSIKLIGKGAQLVPKQNIRVARATTSAAVADADAGEDGVKIPLGPASSKVTQNQARFLERLIKIKKAKGEQDSVTVYSQNRMTNSGWRAQQNKRKADEQAALEDLRKLAGDGDETAERKLEEMEKRINEEHTSEVEAASTTMESGRRLGEGRSRRTPKKGRPKRRAAGGLFRDYRPVEGDEEGADIRGVPTMTPQTWDVLPAMNSNGSSAAATIMGVANLQDTTMPDAPS